MRKGKSVIGKSILSIDEGAKLHDVKDVILGANNHQIVGLVVEEGGLFATSRVVPIEEVSSFGRDAVVVRSSDSVIAAAAAPEIKAILDRHQSLTGTRVFTVDGDDQGTVGDVYFDESTGNVVGLEVSGGMVADAARGTRYLALEEVVRFGRDVLYVHPEVVEQLEAQRGGLTGAVADAGDKVREAGGSAAQTAQNMTDGAASGLAQARPEDSLIGKRTGADVEDDTGGVLVPGGHRITSDDVERARSAGKLPALSASAGMGEAGQAAEGAKDALGDVGDRAADLWDVFTRKVGQATDATGRRVDEEQTKRRLTQIEDVVGRPVTKVFLDLEDRVILDLGDIITHAAIQRAHEAGSLDSLLDSAYKGDVTFDKDEMRAERPGAATIERASTPGVSAPVVDEMRTKVEDAERERAESAEVKKAEDETDRERRAAERSAGRRQRKTASTERAWDSEEAPTAS